MILPYVVHDHVYNMSYSVIYVKYIVLYTVTTFLAVIFTDLYH